MHRQTVIRTIVLLLIVFLTFLFRTYKLEYFYSFEHDQDLYSWIVKDILIEHHPRLIGQMTSIDGFFIGPLYYYLLAPFYFLFSMDPLSATYLALSVSVLTALSIYYVFSTIFSPQVGIVGALIYSTSLSIAFIDRWVVPTQPITLWSVWFLYFLIKLSNKNYKSLPYLAILIGLIWQIHIALLPLIFLIPAAMYPFSSNKSKTRLSILSIVVFFLVTAPFWIFELRHDFGQLKALFSFYNIEVSGEKTGLLRFNEVLYGTSAAFSKIIFFQKHTPAAPTLVIFYLSCILLFLAKIIKPKQIVLIILWTFLVIFFQQVSRRGLSDYYFNNLIIIGILIMSLFLSWLLSTRNLRFLSKVIMIVFVFYNLWNFLKIVPQEGYNQKKAVVQFIKEDSDAKNLPCLAVNFVADFTKSVGYRYLYWYYGLNVVRPSEEIPVYNIALPKALFEKSDFVIGEFAVISPDNKNYREEACFDPNNQLPQLLGFTN